MSIDSNLRHELHEAVDGLDLREEVALQHVKATQPTAWADFTVVALEDQATPHSRHARAQRLVGAVAVCALIAGAVALPVALRNRPRAAAPLAAGQPVTTGYRSTVTVRVGPPPSQASQSSKSSQPSPTTTQPASVKLGDPVQLALRPGLRDRALSRSNLRSDAPGIAFGATADAAGDVLSLTVITPTATETTTLARNWATAFAVARRADAKLQIRERTHNLNLQVTKLHGELQRVDKQLARLAPGTYKDVVHFDGGYGHGLLTPPPPVPEKGSNKLLNLAFERIQILSTLTAFGNQTASLHISQATPEVFAQIISVTPAALIKPPHHDSNSSGVWIAIGLLLGGGALATSSFLLGRRSRGLSFR